MLWINLKKKRQICRFESRIVAGKSGIFFLRLIKRLPDFSLLNIAYLLHSLYFLVPKTLLLYLHSVYDQFATDTLSFLKHTAYRLHKGTHVCGASLNTALWFRRLGGGTTREVRRQSGTANLLLKLVHALLVQICSLSYALVLSIFRVNFLPTCVLCRHYR